MSQAVSYAILVLTIIAFLLTAAALCTPAWQVVYAREIRQWVQSGLWLSCQTRPNGMYSCTYTFSHDDFNTYFSDEVSGFRTPSFYPVIAFGCLIAFAVYSYMVEYRFFHVSVSGIYEKHRGYSWYIALTGAFVYLVAIILSVVHVLLQARNSNTTMSRQNINSSLQSDFFEYQYHPNRSMESFEDRFAMRTLPPVPRQEKKTTVF
ncbi:Clc-like protein 2 [Caenorhabditis elegans]|uniref:Clc-like protein 2 n=1 Tax=Caenorhabditis elegans TaxID=6239 RepID=A0A4V0IK28_CAEEL|nr:Clc-like protein 2 [Caenorhabditis elegans]VTW47476.1 Clc-like protein 2 [Caenorhabditis elegans]